MIQFVAHHIPGASFGIAIIIMTLVIRSAMIPLAVSQYRSQAKMKKMQPELQKLKKKYGDVSKDLENKSSIKRNVRTNEIRRLESTCWLLANFIQMPIFSALYYAISRTEEIRTSSFYG